MKVKKSVSNELMQSPIQTEAEKNKRGYMVYTTSQIMNTSAKSKSGEWLTTGVENAYFFISPEDRIRICQLCTPVLGIVTSRMNRIAGTNFVVTDDKKEIDEIASKLNNYYNIYKEFKNVEEISYVIARQKIYLEIKKYILDCLPDMSNFTQSLLRWKKQTQSIKTSKCNEIENWLQEPNQSTNWGDFIRQYVFDLMVHGSVAIYKQVINNKVENIYILAGGTVIPIRDKFVTAKTGYIQLINQEQPQIFFSDELCYDTYIPISARSHGLIPLEALMTKISELLLFDKLSASGADMTRLPEKMIIINDTSPFGSVEGELKDIVPLAIDEQKRIEKKVNTPVQGGIVSFSGNNATVVDLSRENVMAYYNQRQKDIREDVALVFNMSNMEVNLTGAGDTSGRATSESQQEIDQGKGTIPIIRKIENTFNRYILPFRFGNGYKLKFELSKNRIEEIDYITKKANSGVYSVDEIRINDLNENPFGSEFEKPKGAVIPNGTENSPIITRGI